MKQVLLLLDSVSLSYLPRFLLLLVPSSVFRVSVQSITLIAIFCVLIPHLQVATKAYLSCFKIPLKPALTSLPLHSSVQACIFPPSNYCKSHRISLSTPNGFYLIIQPTACKALWVLQQTRHAKKSVGFLNLSSYLLILANFLFKINLVTAHTGLKSSVASHCLQVKTPCTAHKDVQHLADPILPTSCSGILSWAL